MGISEEEEEEELKRELRDCISLLQGCMRKEDACGVCVEVGGERVERREFVESMWSGRVEMKVY